MSEMESILRASHRTNRTSDIILTGAARLSEKLVCVSKSGQPVKRNTLRFPASVKTAMHYKSATAYGTVLRTDTKTDCDTVRRRAERRTPVISFNNYIDAFANSLLSTSVSCRLCINSPSQHRTCLE